MGGFLTVQDAFFPFFLLPDLCQIVARSGGHPCQIFFFRFSDFQKNLAWVSGHPCQILAMISRLEWSYGLRSAKPIVCGLVFGTGQKIFAPLRLYWRRKVIVIINATIEYHLALLPLFACCCPSLHATVCDRHCSLVIANHRVKVALPLAVADKGGTIVRCR